MSICPKEGECIFSGKQNFLTQSSTVDHRQACSSEVREVPCPLQPHGEECGGMPRLALSACTYSLPLCQSPHGYIYFYLTCPGK